MAVKPLVVQDYKETLEESRQQLLSLGKELVKLKCTVNMTSGLLHNKIKQYPRGSAPCHII